ncbi:MAG: hypothetical protein EBZ77_15065, partial [Chitinophagia bacterium]|nr:hypothetical protein [Chitinophagia bacterium]
MVSSFYKGCRWAVAACSLSVMLSTPETAKGQDYTPNFNVEAQSFADIQVLRYEIPGFNYLGQKEKALSYYLYEAALCGRDIIWDQKSKYGITLRKTLEAMYGTYKGDKTTAQWKQFEEYCGRVWFSNGNHHHYSNEKFIPACDYDYFVSVYNNCDQTKLPLEVQEKPEELLSRMKPVVYDPAFEPKVVDLRPDIDNVVNSSNNFYENVQQVEVETVTNTASNQIVLNLANLEAGCYHLVLQN